MRAIDMAALIRQKEGLRTKLWSLI